MTLDRRAFTPADGQRPRQAVDHSLFSTILKNVFFCQLGSLLPPDKIKMQEEQSNTATNLTFLELTGREKII